MSKQSFQRSEVLRVLRFKALAHRAAIVFASKSEIAEAAKCSESAVRSALRALIDQKLIEQVHVGDSKCPSGYRVIPQKSKGGA